MHENPGNAIELTSRWVKVGAGRSAWCGHSDVFMDSVSSAKRQIKPRPPLLGVVLSINVAVPNPVSGLLRVPEPLNPTEE